MVAASPSVMTSASLGQLPPWFVAYLASLTWASRSLIHLEEQLRVPILGDKPIELGVSDSNLAEGLTRFAADADYARRFASAYPDSSAGPTIEKCCTMRLLWILQHASGV